MAEPDKGDLNAEDIKLLTCTPVLNGRGLDKMVPQSPFLTGNNFQRDATPMIMGLQIKTNGDSEKINLGYIQMNKPNALQAQTSQKGNNPMNLPQIPQFRRAAQNTNQIATPITNTRKNLFNIEKPNALAQFAPGFKKEDSAKPLVNNNQ